MSSYSSGSRLTYSEYLRLNELLKLQSGEIGCKRDINNDETHFIIIHQIFELWFKLVLSELRCARNLLMQKHVDESDIPKIVGHLNRVTEICRLMANQWKVMETLTPQDFLVFRDKLGTASGFESWQMRELEILMGLKNNDRNKGMDPLKHYKRLSEENPIYLEGYEKLKETMKELSLDEVLQKWLERTPIQGSFVNDEHDEELVEDFINKYLNSIRIQNEEALERISEHSSVDKKVLEERFESNIKSAEEYLRPNGITSRSRAGLLFIEAYRDLPLLAWPRKLIDSFVELEEAMVLFRTYHARMVERIIGRRVGTGGSSGVDYLDETTKYRIFKDLWGVRTILIKKSALPTISNLELYGFK
ncbi:MAG: tryptophan 2,3-dioxygenase [Euryarchaeota archaeon]|nr:tryptophan 2,3-dioxygenase [Euryarchaeota archaeon]|tara:strand:- start:668 stop:1753 length:1086 start_codon:yes stop_codon:yes gene_type:complete